MGKFQAMKKHFAIFLALVVCHESLLIQGREIKPLTQHSSLNKVTVMEEVYSPLPLKASVNNIQVPISPSSENKDDATVTPKYGVSSVRNSGVIYTNAFPRFAQEDKDMKAKVVVTQGTSINDVKSNNPGHSPGVGHSQQNKIGQ